jgi:citrate synthase
MMINGLEGVIAAETRLSDVDGERGRLILAGHDVETLAERASFAEAAALLLSSTAEDAAADAAEDAAAGTAKDAAGTAKDAAGTARGAAPGTAKDAAGTAKDAAAALARGRALGFDWLAHVGDALDAADGMDALRAAVAHLPPTAPPLELVGAMATLAAAWARRQAGAAPLPPDGALEHAADYLRMVTGRAPAAAARALDAYLVTVIDHGMNASTFTARVVASTGSDLVSALTAAIGALKGPLHGGAPGPVLDMLDAIGEPAQATAWLEAELAAGRRLMGMGHRIYRVRDPRAAVLERALERLEAAGVRTPRLALARAVEAAAEGALARRHPDRPLKANVEFYTAVLLDAVGLPRPLFSPTFAVARSAGWCAHVAEQRAHGRLIRPSSRYVGRLPE